MDVKNNMEGVSLSFLEGLDRPGKGKSAFEDVSLLNKARDYNVNLDDMENIREGEVPFPREPEHDVQIISEPEDAYEEPALEKTGFEKTDVHLQDVINKCFHGSDRPITIIRDDKIAYANMSFLKLIKVKNFVKIQNHNFLEYVVKDYWNTVAENIGEALTTNKSIQIGMKDSLGGLYKINFDAVYIPDNHTFSFILIGERRESRPGEGQYLYDDVTGLPTYYLLEDRIQTIINSKNSRSPSFGKMLTALIGVSIDNIANFDRLGNTNLILKRLTSRIGLSLNKTYTLARGLKLQFWIFIPDIENEEALNTEVNNIKLLFEAPLEDNFSRYEVKVSLGISVFPEPATSGKKLIEQARLAVEKAQKNTSGKIVYFGA